MAGILNHPQMPLIAGGLTLVLLGGGMYLSLQEEEPTRKTAPVTQVAQVVPPKPAANATPASKPAPVTEVSPAVESAPVQPATEEKAKEDAAPVKAVNSEPVHEVPVHNRQVLTLDINKIREAQLAQDERIKMAMANPAPPKAAPVEPVKVVAQRPKAPVVQAVPVTRPVEQKPKAVEVSKARPVEVAAAQPAVTRAAAPVPQVAVSAGAATVEVASDKNDEYTEIKVTKPSPNLSAEKASSESTAQGPVLVTTSGGKGWVRINSRRTEVVKAGDELPGLGKILSVGPYELVAEKGKLMLSKE